MDKRIVFICMFFWVAVWGYAKTNTLNTGFRYFQFISDVPNITNLNEYATHDSWHNTLDYYFYNRFMNIHGFVGFPSIYTSADASKQLKDEVSIYKNEVNKFDRGTFAGITVAPAITINWLYPLVMNFSIGPSIMTYIYHTRGAADRYYYPLNKINYGLGAEGSAIVTYFFNNRWGISAGVQGSFYWIFNSLKFPRNTIVDITDESALNDRNASSYGLSLGVTYQL